MFTIILTNRRANGRPYSLLKNYSFERAPSLHHPNYQKILVLRKTSEHHPGKYLHIISSPLKIPLRLHDMIGAKIQSGSTTYHLHLPQILQLACGYNSLRAVVQTTIPCYTEMTIPPLLFISHNGRFRFRFLFPSTWTHRHRLLGMHIHIDRRFRSHVT